MRALLFLLAGAAVAGCTGPERGAPSGAYYPSAAPAYAARPAPPPMAGPGRGIAAPPPSQTVRDRAGAAEACRRDADRIIGYRDRGQLMREDERDARIGTDASIYARRVETDRLGRVFERDRIAAECLDQQDTRPTPARR